MRKLVLIVLFAVGLTAISFTGCGGSDTTKSESGGFGGTSETNSGAYTPGGGSGLGGNGASGPCYGGKTDHSCDPAMGEGCDCPDCAATAMCVPGLCTADGTCDMFDSCSCSDCWHDSYCNNKHNCHDDGTCSSEEGCDCADCKDSKACKGYPGTTTGSGGGGGAGGGTGGSGGRGGASSSSSSSSDAASSSSSSAASSSSSSSVASSSASTGSN
jgi:hypothetical protein